jgi:hypothetical protein
MIMEVDVWDGDSKRPRGCTALTNRATSPVENGGGEVQICRSRIVMANPLPYRRQHSVPSTLSVTVPYLVWHWVADRGHDDGRIHRFAV